jgi:HEAT repeat protein
MAVLVALGLLLSQDSMADLLRRLRDDDPAARDAAAAAVLSRWKDWSDPDLDTLRRAADGDDVEVAARAREAVQRIRLRRSLGPAAVQELGGLDADLVRGTPEQRGAALKAVATLAGLGRLPEEALQGLVTHAAEQRWGLPPRDVVDLAKPDPRTFAPLVARVVADPDPALARTAVDLLDEARAVEHFGAVVARLKDPQFSAACAYVLAQTAARAHAPAVAASGAPQAPWILGHMGAVDQAPAAEALLASKDAADLRAGAEALGRMADASRAERVAALLGHEDADVRAEAAAALGRMRTGAAQLVPLLRDRESRVQFATADALAAIGDASVAPAVAALLRDRDTSHLGFAAQVLGRLKAKDRAEDVAALLRHNQPWTRSQAIRALARMEAVDRLGELIALVDDEWDLVRTTAAIALGEMADLAWPKPRREEAARVLRAAAVKDPAAETRIAAGTAVLRLEGPDAVLERRLLEDVEADAADAPSALLEALERLHEKEGVAKLDRTLELTAAVDSPEALRAAVARAGLELARDVRLAGRVPAGRTTLRAVLAQMCEGTVPHVEGPRLHVLSQARALAAWKAYPRNK